MTVNFLILGGLEWSDAGPAQVDIMCSVIRGRRAVVRWLPGQVGRLGLLGANIAMVGRHWWRHGGRHWGYWHARVCIRLMVWYDLSRGETRVAVSGAVVVVSTMDRTGAVVVATHA